MKICIYGMGGMGSFFKNFFENRGYLVRGYDVVKHKSEIELRDVGSFDVIFLCVPMDKIEEAVGEIKKYADKNALLVDIASVKKPFVKIYEKSGFEWMSIHPMFGPDSEIGLSNVIVVRLPKDERAEKILEEFRKSGAVLSYLSLEEHDKEMSKIQSASHFLLLTLSYYLREWFSDEKLKILSPISLTLIKLASRIINQDWRMYKYILENGEVVREEIIKAAAEVDRLIKEDRIQELFNYLRDAFKNGKNTTIILDSARTTLTPNSLEELRGYIKTVDSLILRLIEKRVEAGRRIALEKIKRNEPIEVSEVEYFKLKELTSKTSLDAGCVSKIFEEIMSLTKAEEYKVAGVERKVAVLGPAGSFSEEAALKLIHSKLPLIYCSSVDEIVKAVESGKADFGVLPIENSINGTVIPSLDALLKHDVEVFAETEVEVNLNLAAKKLIDLKEIEVIYSHPQAVSQCMTFINNYLPHAEIRYTKSTSDAVTLLDDKSAAIVSENAAKIYRLQILRRRIQDAKENVTRFYVVRKRGGELKGNVTALFFGVEDRPGALFSVLEIFKRRNINLRKLESRPSGIKLGDYIFFVEAEKKLEEEELRELKERTTFYKVVGVFEKIDRLNVFTSE